MVVTYGDMACSLVRTARSLPRSSMTRTPSISRLAKLEPHLAEVREPSACHATREPEEVVRSVADWTSACRGSAAPQTLDRAPRTGRRPADPILHGRRGLTRRRMLSRAACKTSFSKALLKGPLAASVSLAPGPIASLHQRTMSHGRPAGRLRVRGAVADACTARSGPRVTFFDLPDSARAGPPTGRRPDPLSSEHASS